MLRTASAAAAFLPFCGEAFMGGQWRAPIPREATVVSAEAASSAAPSDTSVGLVVVNEESKLTTSSILGFLAGVWVGGLWVGAALFATTAYLSRKDKKSDVSKALQGISGAGLDTLNFVVSLDSKYEFTSKLGNAARGALEAAKEKPDQKRLAESVSDLVNRAEVAMTELDRDIGFKDTLGKALVSTSEMGYSAVTSMISIAEDLNDSFKVTDIIQDAIGEPSRPSKKGS